MVHLPVMCRFQFSATGRERRLFNVVGRKPKSGTEGPESCPRSDHCINLKVLMGHASKSCMIAAPLFTQKVSIAPGDSRRFCSSEPPRGGDAVSAARDDCGIGPL